MLPVAYKRQLAGQVQCFKSRDDNFLSNQPIFQTHFSLLLVNFGFSNSYWGNRGHVLPPIRDRKSKVKQELRKKRLKLTLTDKIISRKIVVFKLEPCMYVCTYIVRVIAFSSTIPLSTV